MAHNAAMQTGPRTAAGPQRAAALRAYFHVRGDVHLLIQHSGDDLFKFVTFLNQRDNHGAKILAINQLHLGIMHTGEYLAILNLLNAPETYLALSVAFEQNGGEVMRNLVFGVEHDGARDGEFERSIVAYYVEDLRIA
ncbi:MAG: hypothetical protein N2378_11625 [Chloroflexaceae bacterium]|nr:hypothetical protein [Chloroflexaceae bacterium]